MAYEPLHHKYRPQVFADLVGQDAIATTLTNAIQSERIAPAYLFTGPRGTGKTSSARILAKSLNCLSSEHPTPKPCGTCAVCQEVTNGTSLDVLEIDAASNTGVDNIRELIERAQFAPVQCRFKIYCLDEVHMLSTAAFNALLKTLEEPPNRVVFILATTDPQRVLPTIISRCQRFDFRRIALEPMVQHLTYIAGQEAITITPTAVELIAQVAQGGLRDAESLMDQLSLLSGEVDNPQVWDLVGSVPEQALFALLQAIVAQQPAVMIERTHALLDRGREPLVVLQNLAGFYRDLLIAKTAPDRRDLVAITAATWTDLCQIAQQFELAQILASQQHLRSCEGQIKNSTQPRLWLEVSLLGLLPGATSSPNPQPVQRPDIQSLPAPHPAVPSALPTEQNTTEIPVSPSTADKPAVTAESIEEVPPASAASPSVPDQSAVTPAFAEASIPVPTSTPSAPDRPASAETNLPELDPTTSVEPELSKPDDVVNADPELAAAIASERPHTEAEPPADKDIDVTPDDEIDHPLNGHRDSVEPLSPAIPTAIEQEPQPKPIPEPPSQKTPSSPQPTSPVDLANTWQELLQNLNLPSRALLKEHGQLLYWQGREVQIGIRKTLLRLAQGKVAELEETFEKCFHHKVKVTLKVLTEEDLQTRPTPSNPDSYKPAPIRSTAPRTEPAPPAISSSSPHPSPTPPTSEAFSSPPPQSQPGWQNEDETTSAARSFAQFFNGAFINTDPPIAEKAKTAKSDQD